MTNKEKRNGHPEDGFMQTTEMNGKVTRKIIRENIRLFKQLLSEAKGEAEYWGQEILYPKNRRRVIEWAMLMNRSYGIFCNDIEDFIARGIKQPGLSLNQYSELSGMKIVRILLDIINAFEMFNETLRNNSGDYEDELESSIKPQIDSVHINWSKNPRIIKDGVEKQDIIKLIRRKKNTISFKRKALRNMNLINDDEFEFLNFAWDIRNAMHSNFIAHKEIRYRLTDPRSGLSKEFNYDINQEIGISGHPGWILVITGRISRIMMRIIKELTGQSRPGVSPETA